MQETQVWCIAYCLSLMPYPPCLDPSQDEGGKESSRTVDMMVAKDRERVPLHTPFTMEGAFMHVRMHIYACIGHPSTHLPCSCTNMLPRTCSFTPIYPCIPSHATSQQR